MKIILFRLQIFLAFIIANNSNAQNWNDYLNNDWQKTKSSLTVKSIAVSGSWMAGMYLLSYGDEYLNKNVKQLNTGFLKDYFKHIDHLGYGPVTYSTAMGIAGVSFLTNDSKFRKAALTSFESIIATSLIVYTLKISLGRNRPDQKNGPRYFEPFSGWDDSYPSGHSSVAFALVAPWIFYYNKPLTYLLFLLPASTALSRMIYDRHWATDVITGGAIGCVVSYYLVKWHKDFAKKNKSERSSMPLIRLSIPL